MNYLMIEQFNHPVGNWHKRKKSGAKRFLKFLLLLVVPIIILAAWAIFGLGSDSVQVARAATGINEQITYQGKIADNAGNSLATGNYNFKFLIYSVVSGGSPAWTEEWATSTVKISVSHGNFSIDLGKYVSLSSLDFNSDSYYLEIMLDTNNDGIYEETFAPRKRLTSAPYAINSDQVDGFHATSTTNAPNSLLALDANGNLNLFGGAVSTTAITLNGSPVISSQWSNNGSGVYYNGGNVGIGTSTPAAKLSVYSNNIDTGINTTLSYSQNANMAIINLYNNVADTKITNNSITDSLFNVYGYKSSLTTNNTNINQGSIVNYYGFYDDTASNFGSGNGDSKLKYGIKLNISGTADINYGLYTSASGAANNYAIYSVTGTNYFAGNVGIGTASPDAKLEVGDGNGNVGRLSYNDGSLNYGGYFTSSQVGLYASGYAGANIYGASNLYAYIADPTGDSDGTGFITNGNIKTYGNIKSSGGDICTTSYCLNSPSDSRLKINVEPLASTTLDKLLALNPVSFNWNDIYKSSHKGMLELDKNKFGFIAQEVDKIFPEVVTHGSTSDAYLGVDYNKMTPILVKGIQEQQIEIQELKNNQNISVSTSTSSLPDLSVSQSATFYGTITVIGEANFQTRVTFAKDVEVNGKLYVSGDQAGTVKIPAGMTSSTISFTGPYEATPKVVVTPKDIYSLFYAVKNVSTSSFDLIISQSQEKEIDFDWIALATKSQTASTDQVQNNIPEVVIVDPQIPNQSEASSTPTSTPDSEIISSSTDPIIDSSSSTPPEVSSTDSVL